jgi:predicted MFS family arabinose efflux permease
VAADAASTAVVLSIPVLHTVGALTLPVLLGLVAVAGLLRGPGDAAKAAIIPDIVAVSGVTMERATGLQGAAERLASTAGAGLAGVVVATIGPVNALLIDAASFALAALLLALTAPSRQRRDSGPASVRRYLEEFAEGWRFLRSDQVLVAMTVMIFATNLIDQAYVAVLVPVWAYQSGSGVGAVGLLFASFAGAATLGSVVASAVGHRLPRFTTYVVAFLIAGAPRFVVLALDAPLSAILATAVIGGFAAGFINPILGAVILERIPSHLLGRVSSLNTSLCWAGIPFGGLVGGGLVVAVGLAPALLVLGGAYFVATMVPTVQPSWRRLDDRPASDPTTRAEAAEADEASATG